MDDVHCHAVCGFCLLAGRPHTGEFRRLAAQVPAHSQKNLKNRSLKWVPPQVTPLGSRISSPPVRSLMSSNKRVRVPMNFTPALKFLRAGTESRSGLNYMGYLQDSRMGTF